MYTFHHIMLGSHVDQHIIMKVLLKVFKEWAKLRTLAMCNKLHTVVSNL